MGDRAGPPKLPPLGECVRVEAGDNGENSVRTRVRLMVPQGECVTSHPVVHPAVNPRPTLSNHCAPHGAKRGGSAVQGLPRHQA